MAGSAGLDLINDIVKLINDNWTSGGGKRPTVTKIWNTKEVGLADNKAERIIVMLDAETPHIFGLKYTDGDGHNAYDWMHDVSLSIDVWTGISEDRVLDMVNEVTRILKRNVLLTVGTHGYVQMLPTGITSLNEQYRNMYRYMIDIEVKKFNP